MEDNEVMKKIRFNRRLRADLSRRNSPQNNLTSQIQTG